MTAISPANSHSSENQGKHFMNNEARESDSNREEYLSHLKLLQDTRAHANDQYDKMMLPVAGGALFLSMAFLKDIVKEPPYICPGWLMAGWFLLAVSLLSTLFSFLASYYATCDRVREWNQEYNNNQRPKPTMFWTKFTSGCNIVSFSGILLGIICIIIFVCVQITMGGLAHASK